MCFSAFLVIINNARMAQGYFGPEVNRSCLFMFSVSKVSLDSLSKSFVSSDFLHIHIKGQCE